MVPLTGPNKVKAAVFISGTGSNLKSLIKFSKTKKSPISISLIVTNNLKAKGLDFANIYKIKKKIINFRNKKLAEKKILLDLKKNRIQIICLAGFMVILSKKFIKNFEGKIINIHPSLLPKYKGLHAVEQAIHSKDNVTGCTVHYVNNELDGGEIIQQAKVPIFDTDNTEILTKRIQREEYRILPEVIKKLP